MAVSDSGNSMLSMLITCRKVEGKSEMTFSVGARLKPENK